MGRKPSGNQMPWSSTDPNITTAMSLMNVTDAQGDHPQSMTRDAWIDNFGRYFVHMEKNGGFHLFRDYWPSNDAAPPYVVNWDWHPSDEEKAATDWRKYG